ncbi:MAG TPA: hypothetical protein PKY59_13775 [Pyrinomonadaceae bacterium]|nr:hypothetical protein [Pyrinomonadaceae bacterium]
MEIKRRIILQTESFERIRLRKNSKTIKRRTIDGGFYKLEISIADRNGKQIIFETEIHGLIEIEETNNEIRLVSRKK